MSANEAVPAATPDDGIKELENLIERVRAAQRKCATYSQEQVDAIFKAAALAANAQRIPLAKMAVAETGMGVAEDKVIKNHYASEYIYNAYKNTKTCGIIAEDKAFGTKTIAEPIGVIAAVIPIALSPKYKEKAEIAEIQNISHAISCKRQPLNCSIKSFFILRGIISHFAIVASKVI